MSQKPVNITLGTAGHIDHGKTALVKLLTGCETDTLKAEKERGMSIDLGFAPCTIAGLTAGIVDVPGHEHFIKTMTAGASGMDAVILVVAADDGVMPQTREHLDILTLLGVQKGLVVLTKIDRVSPAQVDERRGELARFLAGTFLDGAPICPLSNVTGEGFDGFHGALSQLVRSVCPKSPEGVFRMPVDRAFSPKGFGTVVTGIPVSGRISTGDEVVLLPAGTTGRINAIQVYGENSDTALAGQCAALNVRRWDAGAVERGHTVAAPGYFEPLVWYACRLRLLPNARLTLKNAARVAFHTGTAETTARVYLMSGEKIAPGEHTLAQVRLNRPVVAGPGDRFIIRSLSPAATIGGGMIVEGLEQKLKRSRPAVLEDLAKRADAIAGESTFVLYCLEAGGLDGLGEAALARRVKLPRGRPGEILADLSAAGEAVLVTADIWLHSRSCAAAEAKITAALEEFHGEKPESPGMTAEALSAACALPAPVFQGLLGKLESDRRLSVAGGRYALAGHRVTVSEADREVFERVESLFRQGRFHPPSVDEIIAESGFEPARVKKAVGSLLERAILVRAAEGLFFHAEAVAAAREKLVDFIAREGRLESVKFKYLLDTTRKYAIPLLDYFDSTGVTVRVGNTRYLRER